MQQTKNMRLYKKDIKHSLENNFLREAMDNFAQSYRIDRGKAFSEIDRDRLIKKVLDIKDKAILENETLLKKILQNAEKKAYRSITPKPLKTPIKSLRTYLKKMMSNRSLNQNQ